MVRVLPPYFTGQSGYPTLKPCPRFPHIPKQNGLVERIFRSLMEECVWQCSQVGYYWR